MPEQFEQEFGLPENPPQISSPFGPIDELDNPITRNPSGNRVSTPARPLTQAEALAAIDKMARKENPYYGSGYQEPDFVPVKGNEKFLEREYGYLYGQDNEDFYGQRQSGLAKLGSGLLKLPLYTLTKLGSGVGFLAGLADPRNMFADEGYISAAADNAMSKAFEGLEEKIKNQLLPTYQEASDRNQGFWRRAFTDANFWAEDATDALAFLASAYVPGLAVSKLKVGLNLAKGLSGLRLGATGAAATVEGLETAANYLKHASTIAKNFDKGATWALATASEAMVEAHGVKKQLEQSLENQVNPNTGLPYTREEKDEIIGGRTRDTFLMNAALLGFTNFFEIKYFYKALGKSEGVVQRMTQDALGDAWKGVPEPTGRMAKFLNGPTGQFLKGATLGLGREGYLEENAQLAIERFNVEHGKAGQIMKMRDYAGIFGDFLGQTRDIIMGKDPEGSISVGLGGLLGGVPGGIGQIRQATQDKLTTQSAIDMLNLSQENWLKFGNIYKKETIEVAKPDGTVEKREKIVFNDRNEPEIDTAKLASIMTGLKTNVELMNESDKESSLLRQKLFKDAAFSNYVLTHINAGIEDNLIQKLEEAASAKPEDLINLGFDPTQDTQQQINDYKALAADIIKKNKLINRDIIFDGKDIALDKARKNGLLNLAIQQSIYSKMAAEINNEALEIKNAYVNQSNSALSDGIVEQLNNVQYRIDSQKEFLESLKKADITSPIILEVNEALLKELENEKKELLKQNELSVEKLKKDGEYYKYEKNERNYSVMHDLFVKKQTLKGQIDNVIRAAGLEFAKYADAKNGGKNFALHVEEDIVKPINQAEEDRAAEETAEEEAKETEKKGPRTIKIKYKDAAGEEQEFEITEGDIFQKKEEDGTIGDRMTILGFEKDDNILVVRFNNDETSLLLPTAETVQLLISEAWEKIEKPTKKTKTSTSEDTDEETEEEGEEIDNDLEQYSTENRKPKFEEVGFNKTFGKQYLDLNDQVPNTEGGRDRFYAFTAKYNVYNRDYALEVLVENRDKFGIREPKYNPDDIKLVLVKKVTDPETGDVSYQYVDENNNLIPEGQANANNIIYTSLSNIKTYTPADIRNVYTVSASTSDEDIQEKIDEHIAYQKDLIQRVQESEEPVYLDAVATSPGVQRIERLESVNKDDKYEIAMAEVEGRIIEKDPDFSNLRSIINPDMNIGLRVATIDGAIAPGIKAARAVMQEYSIVDGRKIYGDKTFRVFTRKLTDTEKDLIMKTLMRLSDLYLKKYPKGKAKVKLSPEQEVEFNLAINFLRKTLNWSRPKAGKSGERHFWISNGLHYGGKTIPFNRSALEKNKDEILNNVYHHIDNKALQENEEFQLVTFDKLGHILPDKENSWGSYEEYLLAKRTGEDIPPVYTSLPMYDSKTPQRTSAYIIWRDPSVEPQDKSEAEQAKAFAAATKYDREIDKFLNLTKKTIEIRKTKFKMNEVPEDKGGGYYISVVVNGRTEKSKVFKTKEDILANKSYIIKNIAAASGYIYGGNRALLEKALKAQEEEKKKKKEQKKKPQQETVVEEVIEEKTEEETEDDTPFETNVQYPLTIEDAVNNAVVKEGSVYAAVYKRNPDGSYVMVVDAEIPIEKGNLTAAKTKLRGRLLKNWPSDDEVFRLTLGEAEIKEDFDKLQAFMNQNLPQFAVNKMNDLIRGRAYGSFKNGAIYIYENAEIGTGYHEAFEGVWYSYLSDSEQAELAKEFRSREGSFKNPFTGVTKPYSEASNYDVREMLAEEFREYILNGTAPSTPKAKGFFQKLWEFIKQLLGLSKQETEEMESLIHNIFDNIRGGKYRNANTIREYSDLSSEDRTKMDGLSQKQTLEVLEGLTYYFFAELFKKGNNINTILSELDPIASNKLLVDTYNAAYNEMIAKLANINTDYVNIVSANKTGKLYELFKKNLSRYDLNFDELDELDENKVNDPLGIRDSITIDPRSRTSANIKALIASLPNVTHLGGTRLRHNLNSMGQPMLVNRDRIHTILLNELSNITEIIGEDGVKKNILDQMMARLDKKFKDNAATYRDGYGWIQSLKYRLRYLETTGAKVDPATLSKDDVQLRLAFTKSFTNIKFTPNKLIITDNGDLFNLNPLMNVNEKRIRETWANNLKVKIQNKDTNLVKVGPDGKLRFNTSSEEYYDLTVLANNPHNINFDSSLWALDQLGITFTADPRELQIDNENAIREQLVVILHMIKTGELEDIFDLFYGKVVGGRLNGLIAIENEYSSEDNILSYYTADGEPQHAVTTPSLYANMINIINSVGSLKELIMTAPWLGTIDSEGNPILNAYQANSLLLRPGGILFDSKGKRIKGNKMRYDVLSGIGISDYDGTTAAKLQFPERIALKAHYLFGGGSSANQPSTTVFSIINSDKSTEFGITIPGTAVVTPEYIRDWENKQDKVVDIYTKHLKDEMYAAIMQKRYPVNIQYYRTGALTLGHFKDIISPDLMERFKNEVLNAAGNETDLVDVFVELYSDEISNQIKLHLNNKIEETKRFLVDNDLFVMYDPYRSDNYITNAIDNDMLNSRLHLTEDYNKSQTAYVDGEERSFYTPEDLDVIAGVLALNEEILAAEQHKLIYGHPAMYKDLPKRANGSTSSKEAIIEDSDVISWMDSNEPRLDGKIRSAETVQTMKVISFADVNVMSAFYNQIAEEKYKVLSQVPQLTKVKIEKIIGARFDDNGKVTGFILGPDGEFSGVIKSYMNMTEADGMAMGMPDLVKDMLFLSNKFDAKKEKQWNWEVAYERLVRSGTIPSINKKDKFGNPLTIKKGDPEYKKYDPAILADDLKRYNEGEAGQFEMMKPQYFGYAKTKGVTHPVFLKHALQPKFYRHVEGTQFEALYLAAQKNKVDIIGFESGQKVGNVTTDGGTFVPAYNDKGSINIISDDKGQYNLNPELPVQTLYSKFYGIQVQQQDKQKREVVRGTQITKIIMTNFYENGSPLNQEIAGIIEEYNSVLTSMIKLGKETLLKELGLQKVGDQYEIKDITNLINTLRSEIEKRDLPDNIIDAIAVVNNELQYSFDTLIHRDKIDNILQAMVDDRVISEKMSGRSAPQVASTLYEANPRSYVYKKDGVYVGLTKEALKTLTDAERDTIRMTSNDLKFYRNNKGVVTSMEAYVSWPFDQDPEEFGLKLENGIYKITDKARIDPRLLKLIGFRIPTQAPNSIESIVIKGFTPKANGDIIVVPSEIVGKSGSDFDIDKLNLYSPNYKIAGMDFSSPVFKNFMLQDMISRGLAPEMAQQIIDVFSPKHFEAINQATFTEKGKIYHQAENALQDLADKWKTISADELEFIKRSIQKFNKLKRTEERPPKYLTYYEPDSTKAGLQNRYIELMHKLVLHESNYEQLTTPNSTANLEMLANRIKTAKVKAGTKSVENEKSATYLRSFIGSLMTRQRYILAKRMVGISALHTTFHSMAQIAGLKVNGVYDTSRIKYLMFLDKKALMERQPVPKTEEIKIGLRHHAKDTDGLYSIGYKRAADGTMISDNFSEATSGFVDGAKNPFVFDLNLSLDTANTWFYLQHMGVGPEELSFFFGQPILDDYFKELSKNKSSFKKINGDNLFREDLFYKVIAPWFDKQFPGPSDLQSKLELSAGNRKWNADVKNKTKLLLQQVYESIDEFTMSDMEDAIAAGKNADPKMQLAVLMHYLRYQEQADQLTTYMNAIKYDTGKTRTIQENILQVSKWERSKNKEFIANPEAILQNTFLGEMKTQKEDVFNMFRNFFITLHPNLQSAFDRLYEKIDDPDLFLMDDTAIEMINRYQNHILNYLLHTTPYSEDGKQTVLNELYSELFTGDSSLAKTLYDLKESDDDIIRENLIVKELLPLITDDINSTNNIMLFRNRMDTFEVNNVIEAVEDLKMYAKDTANNELLKFVNNLGKFTIIQSGLNTSYIDFKKVLSLDVYSDLVKTILDRFNVNPEIDVDQVWKTFHQNNYNNRSIVPKAPGWVKYNSEYEGLTIPFDHPSSINDFYVKFMLKEGMTKEKRKELKKSNKSREAYQAILFQKTDQIIKTDRGQAVVIYKAVPTLGNGNKMVEIYTDPNTESILEKNKNKVITSGIAGGSKGWVSYNDIVNPPDAGETEQTSEEKTTEDGWTKPPVGAIQSMEDLKGWASQFKKDIQKTISKKEKESKPCNSKKKKKK